MGIGDPRGIVAPQKGVGAADTAGVGGEGMTDPVSRAGQGTGASGGLRSAGSLLLGRT